MSKGIATNNVIIVDADSFNKTLRTLIFEELKKGKIKVANTRRGKFHEELRGGSLPAGKKRQAMELYVLFEKAKYFHFVCSKLTKETFDRITTTKCAQCISKCSCISSNDQHVLAVAIVTDANVIVTNDRKLASDFENLKDIHLNFNGLPGHKLTDSGKRSWIFPESVDASISSGPSSEQIRKVLRGAKSRPCKNNCMDETSRCGNQSLVGKRNRRGS